MQKLCCYLDPLGIWVVVKLGSRFGYPKFQVPQYNKDPKGSLILTSTHIDLRAIRWSGSRPLGLNVHPCSCSWALYSKGSEQYILLVPKYLLSILNWYLGPFGSVVSRLSIHSRWAPGRFSIHKAAFLPPAQQLRLMDKILHDAKDPKLCELWYIPYNG